jgi:hypothetical protein
MSTRKLLIVAGLAVGGWYLWTKVLNKPKAAGAAS